MEVRETKKLNKPKRARDVEMMKANAAQFMRCVFKREARAREIEAESLESFAKRKGITIVPEKTAWKGRRGPEPGPAAPTAKPKERKLVILNPQPKYARNPDGSFAPKPITIWGYEDQDT